LANLRLRDRDAIVTKEGLIFRVLGYDHPPEACFCDLEYAPTSIFKSINPKAPRGHGKPTYYKLYEDEAWTYLETNYPKYLTPHAMLQKRVIGVRHCDIVEVRRPQEMLKRLLARPEKDELLTATRDVLELVTKHSGLRSEDFGVFGSMLHGFHHPELSDIDLIVYGRENTIKLREALRELYGEASPLRNEFDTNQAVRGKRWRFRNLSPEEYMWHQQRKLIYALFKDKKSGRTIKTEFEPVKDWKEINNEYDSGTKILPRGWVKITAQIAEDSEASFIPSKYGTRSMGVLESTKESDHASRVVSYLEEFRLQAGKGERVFIEGNLEEITTSNSSFHQIALTHCPRYYEQVLKSTTRSGVS
jgi:predicted nucleotidyltransferase